MNRKISPSNCNQAESYGAYLGQTPLPHAAAAAAKSLQSRVFDFVRPYRWQPTRLSHPWDSPGKNTGVGCHFLLQCVKVKSESEVTQLCPTLRDPMDCSQPGSSVHGISQARVLEWGAIVYLLEFMHLSNSPHTLYQN